MRHTLLAFRMLLVEFRFLGSERFLRSLGRGCYSLVPRLGRVHVMRRARVVLRTQSRDFARLFAGGDRGVIRDRITVDATVAYMMYGFGDAKEPDPDSIELLARFLYVYINKAPNTPLPPLEREFLKLVLSQSGQNVVLKDGYIPLPARVVEGTLRNLGI